MGCLNLLRSLSRMKFAIIKTAEAVHKVRGSGSLPNDTLSSLRKWELYGQMNL